MSNKKFLIFNGSPRKKGTSYSFARTIAKLVKEYGNTAEIIHIIEYLEEGKSIESLKETISKSDILVLSCPLYVDSLPHPVIWFFEELMRDYKNVLKGKSFFAVGQCAFPYAELLNTLLGSCRCFAEAAEMKWLGGLGYGGGVMINGELMENLGKKGEKITSAFKCALQDVYEDKAISSKAQAMLAMKFPKIFGRPMAAFLNHKIKVNGNKHGFTVADLEKKAYLE
jgi:multimeric flavodoxin WrbA